MEGIPFHRRKAHNFFLSDCGTPLMIEKVSHTVDWRRLIQSVELVYQNIELDEGIIIIFIR